MFETLLALAEQPSLIDVVRIIAADYKISSSDKQVLIQAADELEAAQRQQAVSAQVSMELCQKILALGEVIAERDRQIGALKGAQLYNWSYRMKTVTPKPMPTTGMPDRLDGNLEVSSINDQQAMKAGIKHISGSDMNINKK